MDNLTGMHFHSAEAEVERLEQQLAAAQARESADIADANTLRTQLAEIATALGVPIDEPPAAIATAAQETDAALQAAEAEVAGLRAENADLLIGHAELTRRLNIANQAVDDTAKVYSDRLHELSERLRTQIELNRRTLSLQDDEVAEFNAGYEAAVNGVPLECEPDDLPFDVWTHGWKSADHKRLSAEVADLRRQLAELQAANQWHAPSETMPAEFIPIVAYWQEDGAWITILCPTDSGLVDDADSRWNTYPDGSWRPAPVCWRYIPGPPGLVPDMAKEDDEEDDENDDEPSRYPDSDCP